MVSLERSRTEFEQPVRQIIAMLVALAAVGTAAYFLYQPIRTVFFANVGLNALIMGVFVIGMVSCFWQVFSLMTSVSWIEGFAIDRPGHEFVEPPRLLRSLSSLLRDQRARQALTSTSTRSILDSVAMRIDESRDITRYIINLLIFLGLLGTFWGLSLTVPEVVNTIRSLQPDANGSINFEDLMSGLEKQLDGMGTAFASSLLGLAGSLVVGLLEVFASRAQNQFFREMEDWLSGITRISVTGDAEDGDQVSAAAALMEQNSAQIAELTSLVAQMFARAEEGDRKRSIDPEEGARQLMALDRIAERLEQLPTANGGGDGTGMDQETQDRIRNIDRQLLRMTEEVAAGRQDAVAELRAEISGLTRAMTQLAERR
ncbi:MAG: biopolymer transporter ExbB [Pseudomonadota bacterium]